MRPRPTSHPRFTEHTTATMPPGDGVAERTVLDDPLVARSVGLLTDRWGGSISGSVAGRVQVDLGRLQIFVSRLTEPEVTARTLLERPLSFSALCGLDLDPRSPYRETIVEFLDEPGTLTDLTVVALHAPEILVWLDRHLDEDTVEAEGLDVVVHNFVTAALVLAMELEPHERSERGGT